MPQHGSPTTILLGSFDLTGYFNDMSATKSTEAVDVTTFHVTSRDRNYIAGLGEGSATLSGIWDATLVSGSDVVLDAALAASTTLTFTLGGYATLGNKCILLQAKDNPSVIRSTISDAVKVDVNFTADNMRMNGVVLQDLAAETTTFNGASVDNLAGTTLGGVAHLHVTAFSGTSGVLKVQHSTNDSVWNDLVTFATVTGVTSERATVTSTVSRYLRFAITADTFTSMTVFAAFARNTY